MLQAGLVEYIVVVLLTVQLLRGLVASGSLTLLEVLISIMCREVKHVHEDQIQSSLQDFLARYKGEGGGV